MTSLIRPGFAARTSAASFPGACSSPTPPADLRRIVWDALIIGAGPAGAASAFLLARRGWRVLLVDRSAWPREKVCGGCLSASAVACLREIGLAPVLRHATPIVASHLYYGQAHARLPVSEAFAIDRSTLDCLLVDALVARGGTFASGASASLLPLESNGEHRVVRVGTGDAAQNVSARVVLACDGLSGSSLSEESWSAWEVAPDAYLGVASTVSSEALPIDSGEIHMHIGAGGYVGAVRYDDGRVHLAAALDARQCREAGGPAHLMTRVLASCERAVPAAALVLKGAPTLTRRRRTLGGHRVLAVGDACGYVEPFTGEGIAWALRSAIEATRLLDGSWSESLPRQWARTHDNALGAKQSICRAVRYAVRRPLLAAGVIHLLRWAPELSTFITRDAGRRA